MQSWKRGGQGGAWAPCPPVACSQRSPGFCSVPQSSCRCGWRGSDLQWRLLHPGAVVTCRSDLPGFSAGHCQVLSLVLKPSRDGCAHRIPLGWALCPSRCCYPQPHPYDLSVLCYKPGAGEGDSQETEWSFFICCVLGAGVKDLYSAQWKLLILLKLS